MDRSASARQLAHDLLIRPPVVFWGVGIATLLGALGALAGYRTQLAAAPLGAFPFIPDSAVASLLAAAALLALRANKRWPLLYALAAFACLKYGLWTLLFWLRQWGGAAELLQTPGIDKPAGQLVSYLAHLGLVHLGLVFLAHSGALSLAGRLQVVAWFALFVFIDYGHGYHQALASHVPVAFAFWTAAGLTAALGVVLLRLPGRRERGRVPG